MTCFNFFEPEKSARTRTLGHDAAASQKLDDNEADPMTRLPDSPLSRYNQFILPGMVVVDDNETSSGDAGSGIV